MVMVFEWCWCFGHNILRGNGLLLLLYRHIVQFFCCRWHRLNWCAIFWPCPMLVFFSDANTSFKSITNRLAEETLGCFSALTAMSSFCISRPTSTSPDSFNTSSAVNLKMTYLLSRALDWESIDLRRVVIPNPPAGLGELDRSPIIGLRSSPFGVWSSMSVSRNKAPLPRVNCKPLE